VLGAPRIYYRSSLAPQRADFVVAHELAHWALGTRLTEDENDIESACDALAAALIAPRRAFLDAVRAYGTRLPRLARAFQTTESLTALRLGETTGEPLALVAPRSVRVRGAMYSWPGESQLRALAAARRSGPGLRNTRLRDDPRRTVLRAVGEF